MPRPEIVAHRGLPRRSRENTLDSFALALAAGAEGLELDVHATSDGRVIVHHDPSLPSGAGGAPGLALAATPWAALRREPPAMAIPTLDDVLALVGTRAQIYVEIKARAIEPLVIDTIRRHSARCAIHSFDHRASVVSRRLAPDLPTGVLVVGYLLDAGATLRGTEARDYWQQWEMIDAPLVDAIHAAAGRVVAWTVNDEGAMRRLAAMGVDAICTDVTDVALAALGDGG